LRGVLIKLGVPLGRLPGDIVIRGERSSFYFPIVTCIVVSVVLTLIGWLLRSESHRRTPQAHGAGRLMAIKADRWIRKMALEHGMIEPFVDSQVREGVVSYGLSSYGYDIRVADEFKVFTNINNTVIDPKNFDPQSFVDIKKDVCIVPPNSFALARTIEYFRIPRDCPDGVPRQVHLCALRDHRQRHALRARVGGYVTLEISNTTPLPARIYANEGLAQVLFFQSDEPCERSYADKKGKYQKQTGVTFAQDLGDEATRLRGYEVTEATRKNLVSSCPCLLVS
jgi:dCTP deaminase